MKRNFGETNNGSEHKRQRDNSPPHTEASTGHPFDYARNVSQMNTPGLGTSDTRPRTRHSNPEGSSWLQRPDDLVLGIQLGQIDDDQSTSLRSYAHTYNTGQL